MDAPKRKLDECRLSCGGNLLTVTVRHGKRSVTTRYLVARPKPGVVVLTKDGEGEPEVYTVERGRCSCKWWQYRLREGGACKHICAALSSGLLDGGAETTGLLPERSPAVRAQGSEEACARRSG